MNVFWCFTMHFKAIRTKNVDLILLTKYFSARQRKFTFVYLCSLAWYSLPMISSLHNNSLAKIVLFQPVNQQNYRSYLKWWIWRCICFNMTRRQGCVIGCYVLGHTIFSRKGYWWIAWPKIRVGKSMVYFYSFFPVPLNKVRYCIKLSKNLAENRFEVL